MFSRLLSVKLCLFSFNSCKTLSNSSLEKCCGHLSRVDQYQQSEVKRRGSARFPVCIGNYPEAAAAAVWLIVMDERATAVGVTIEAARSPI